MDFSLPRTAPVVVAYLFSFQVFLKKYLIFTALYWFLPYSSVNQP